MGIPEHYLLQYKSQLHKMADRQPSLSISQILITVVVMHVWYTLRMYLLQLKQLLMFL